MNKYTTTTHRTNKADDLLYVGILTGTVGYRERVKGIKILKTLGDCSILEYQFNVLRHTYPKAHVTITVGFQADKIIRLRPENSSIVENRLYEQENTAEEIRLLLNTINPTKLLLIEGAVCFDEESIRKTTESSSVFVYTNPNDDEVGMHIEDNKVLHFSYGLNEKWAGIVYLEGKALESFKKIITRENNKLCLHELLNILIDKKVELKAVSSNKSKLTKF